MRKFAVKVLALAVGSLMTVSFTKADTAVKNIGDLEIYQSAAGGTVTVMMMLDTSGSMSALEDAPSACDLPSDARSSLTYNNVATTSIPYAQTGCKATASTREYYYRRTTNSRGSRTWYRCGTNSDGTVDYGADICSTRLSSAPNTNSFNYIRTSSGRYYYKTTSSTTLFPDRITRLKDAIFYLMNAKDSKGKYLIDSGKVAIGIGQFSAQTRSDNTTKLYRSDTLGDGKTGKILVPAALLNDNQREKIKNAVASLEGSNGTPSANAYADAGAYMLGTTTNIQRNNNSGFTHSVSTSKSDNDYVSPIPSRRAQCDGQGIYFLTDGLPNSSSPNEIMKIALSPSFTVPDYTTSTPPAGVLPYGSENGNAWPAIGAFSKALRITSQNPKNLSIRTAVVGFGSVFDTSAYTDIKKTLTKPLLDTNTSLPIAGKFRDDAGEYFDCSKIPSNKVDARNACNWGAKSHPDLPGVGGYGEGGFYSAQSKQDVIDSLTKFLGDLNNEIATAPSGTISVPNDPFRIFGSLANGYLPTITAQVAGSNNTSLIWPGNLKKYKIANGTLYGKNNKLLFSRDMVTTSGATTTESIAGILNPSTQDLWQIRNKQIDGIDANNIANAGGVYESLKAPNITDGYNIRTVYVEDVTEDGATTTTLRKLSVNTSTGRPIGFDALLDTEVYDRNNQIRLLKFLGFNRGTYTASGGTAIEADLDSIPDHIAISDIILSKPISPIKVLGGNIHSKPLAISYGADLDANTGRLIESSRKDYILYGSMDGVLHLIKADDAPVGGKENIAIIPRVMMINQPDAIEPNAKYTVSETRPAGVPNFGIDAPWVLSAQYDYNYTSNKITPNSTAGIYIYGGMRLGGKGILGFKLPDDITVTNPTITPAFSNKALIDNDTADFGRLSYIFNEPTIAKMKTSDSDTTGTDVLIFGGGYDTCYENQYFQIGVTADTTNKIASDCAAKTEAEGNAIYIINAKTGQRLWSTTYDGSASGVTEGKKYMKNSIVAGVTVLDRDNDGFIDHLYAADLGGQVFRIDFKNGNVNTSNVNITRILADNQAGTQYARRFYERPNFSVYRDTSGALFGLVNVISGDRSSPLSTLRATDAHADRVYGILDRDITKSNNELYPTGSATFTASVKDLVVNDTATTAGTSIENLWTAMGTMPSSGYTAAQRTTVINNLANGTKKAWYYPLNRFDGHTGVKYSKGVGVSQVINSILYTSVYNPDMVYSQVDPCSATIKGGTEREMYCLPYGICTQQYDASTQTGTKTGTGGFLRAGQGIQELNFGPVSSSNMTTSVMISTVPISYLVNPDRRVNSGSGGYALSTGSDIGLNQTGVGGASDTQGDSSGKISLNTERYVAKPITWFEN